jgi:tRNA (guanine26-N2/guanine27-N2)-dimethyltransferase
MVIQENNQEFVQIQEEQTKLLVPVSSLTDAVPSKSPAFFNKMAKLNRDISILAYRAFAMEVKESRDRSNMIGNNGFMELSNNEAITFADALSGTGARALRVAVEAPEIAEIHINDINRLAVDKAKLSAEINGVEYKCFFNYNDVHKFLAEHKTKDERRFVIADLDPFGSPTPYIDSLLRSVRNGGLISVTATDTAVLCGVYPKVCIRKYLGRPINNGFSNETGIRLLISLISLMAARFEFVITPIFVHANFHYLRVYLRIERSSSKANKMHENLGFIQYCFRCGNRKNVPLKPTASQFGVAKEKCGLCGGGFYAVGGPLWCSKLFDKQYVKKMNHLRSTAANVVTSDTPDLKIDYNNQLLHDEKFLGVSQEQRKNRSIDPIQKSFEVVITELDSIPYYFRSDEISSYLKRNPLPLNLILEKLASNGFNASRTSLNPGAFKSDAPLSEIISILK